MGWDVTWWVFLGSLIFSTEILLKSCFKSIYCYFLHVAFWLLGYETVSLLQFLLQFLFSRLHPMFVDQNNLGISLCTGFVIPIYSISKWISLGAFIILIWQLKALIMIIIILWHYFFFKKLKLILLSEPVHINVQILGISRIEELWKLLTIWC